MKIVKEIELSPLTEEQTTKLKEALKNASPAGYIQDICNAQAMTGNTDIVFALRSKYKGTPDA